MTPEERRALAVEEVLSDAPPLGDETRERLSVLLRGGDES